MYSSIKAIKNKSVRQKKKKLQLSHRSAKHWLRKPKGLSVYPQHPGQGCVCAVSAYSPGEKREMGFTDQPTSPLRNSVLENKVWMQVRRTDVNPLTSTSTCTGKQTTHMRYTTTHVHTVGA